MSPKVLVEHLLSKHGEVRVPRFRGGTVSQKGPGPGDHSTAPNGPPAGPPPLVLATVSNPSSPDPMVLSQPSREDGPSTQQSDPAAEVPMETSQPQGSQEPLLMETSQSGSQTGSNEVPQEAADPSPDGPSPVFSTGSIEGRITPEVPLPRDPESDDGWAQIDRVGGWRAVISPLGAMDQVPAQNKAVWA